MFSKLSAIASEALAKCRLSSAVAPSMWICLLVVPLGMYAATRFEGKAQIFCFVLVSFVVAIFAFAFLYLLFTDPDKLRSESYELRKHALNLIEEKGGKIPISDASIQAIANPNYVENSTKEVE